MQSGLVRWIVNLVSFVLLVLLVVTGLSAWLLPHGGGPAGAAHGVQQFLRAVHRTGALLFVATIVVHLLLHAGYIQQNLKKFGLIKRPPA